PVLTVAQRLAETGDVHTEAALLDRDARPYARHQLPLRDDIAGLLHEQKEDVERAAAERHRLALLGQAPLQGEEAKWPELNAPGLARHASRFHGGTRGRRIDKMQRSSAPAAECVHGVH